MGTIYIKNYPSRKQHPNSQTTKNSFYLIFFEIITILLLTSFLYRSSQPKKILTAVPAPAASAATVLGESTQITSTPTILTPTNLPLPSPLPTQQITPTKIPIPTLPKSEYSIAIIGDSMVDTMGERLEYLEKELKKKYPQTNFKLYNYGIGSETVEMGLNRLDKEFNYQDRHYPALSQVKPDILIVASFAYNPFFPYDRNKHWLLLASLIEKAKTISPQVYTLAEIAPVGSKFGQGPHGVNWSQDTALTHSNRIIEQLENIIGLSRNLNVTLIDAFYPSQNSNSAYGKKEYVNSDDGIHPSVTGHQFMAEKIVQIVLPGGIEPPSNP